MSATSTSGADGGAASSASPENPFLPSPAPIPLDASDPGLTQAVPFSSGNPRIEETRGVMHLYPSGSASPSNLPVGRKPLVCVLAVPNHMTYADFCQFCGSFIQHMLEMRIVRNDGIEDHYSALIRFDDQESADDFYRHFNGKCFSSLDVSVCNVLFTVDVQYTGSIEHAQSPVASSADQPTCPVCLERLDQDASGILTTICNHSFHCSCISKWTDSSCPVCRYCQQQPEKVSCFVCGVSEDLRMCIICGFVGCEGNNGRHAECHWMEAGHGYALELHSRRVWDYAGQDYVHRLIQSKTDGKLVELHTCCPHEGKTGLKALEEEFDDKIQAIHKEFEELLTSQTLNQRKHYESLILEAEDENEKEITEAIERAASQKLQKLQLKFDKCVKEKKFLDEINENLQKNQEAWKLKIAELEQGEQAAVGLREKRIQALEEQLRGLMLDIETQQAEDESPGSTSTGTKTGAVLVAPTASPTNDGSKHASRNRRRT